MAVKERTVLSVLEAVIVKLDEAETRVDDQGKTIDWLKTQIKELERELEAARR